MFFGRDKSYSMGLVRWWIGIVFFLFGLDQILKPENWLAWMPQWIGNVGLGLETIIILLGVLNLVAGGLLLLGWKVRWGAGYAILHVLGIVLTIGWSDTLIRDLGLLLAALGVFLSGGDRFCLWKKS